MLPMKIIPAQNGEKKEFFTWFVSNAVITAFLLIAKLSRIEFPFLTHLSIFGLSVWGKGSGVGVRETLGTNVPFLGISQFADFTRFVFPSSPPDVLSLLVPVVVPEELFTVWTSAFSLSKINTTY